MSAGSWPAASSQLSHPYFQPLSRLNDTGHNYAHHPEDLSFLGTLPLSHHQAIQNFDTWNCSPQGCFPSQLLQGPGQTGLPPPSPLDYSFPAASHKRKRTTSPESATAGSSRPTSDRNPDGVPNQMATDLSPVAEFGEQKNAAYDVWAFV
jgi:hypothetical protein